MYGHGKTQTTRSIKAETFKAIHRPQYLPTKKKDTASICPHMGGEAVEREGNMSPYGRGSSGKGGRRSISVPSLHFKTAERLD